MNSTTKLLGIAIAFEMSPTISKKLSKLFMLGILLIFQIHLGAEQPFENPQHYAREYDRQAKQFRETASIIKEQSMQLEGKAAMICKQIVKNYMAAADLDEKMAVAARNRRPTEWKKLQQAFTDLNLEIEQEKLFKQLTHVAEAPMNSEKDTAIHIESEEELKIWLDKP